jgi:hypothetical protein
MVGGANKATVASADSGSQYRWPRPCSQPVRTSCACCAEVSIPSAAMVKPKPSPGPISALTVAALESDDLAALEIERGLVNHADAAVFQGLAQIEHLMALPHLAIHLWLEESQRRAALRLGPI